eukprot:CAMPEP_0168349176 /NCGR_PEP_ID=MMETSP0213-20121227/20241_1 /TAXON_ID=151035 /ORGANISM="Euplotes harpa, Strain FSP1.4" /LENGTH=192 /DNA_ID=CAMNT_0008359029 /DNA_START=675 /DNA_END=1250 /DNA_ORIENTATION=+
MKNLKLHSYLAKIMNLEDTEDLDEMSEKKKREILNTSLNVTRKKKKGLSKEDEEELRRKQESLFRSDQSLSMLPPEYVRTLSTPTFQPDRGQLDPSHHYRDQQVSAAEDIEVQEKEEEDFEEDNEVNTEVKNKLPSLQAFRGVSVSDINPASLDALNQEGLTKEQIEKNQEILNQYNLNQIMRQKNKHQEET